MTFPQWIFTYQEILKNEEERVKKDYMSKDYLLDHVSFFIDMLGLVIDKDKGGIAMQIKEGIRDEARKKKQENNPKNESEEENKTETIDGPYQADDILSEQDAELLNFFESVPDKMDSTESQESTGKYVLPTVDIKKLQLGFSNNESEQEEGEVSSETR